MHYASNKKQPFGWTGFCSNIKIFQSIIEMLKSYVWLKKSSIHSKYLWNLTLVSFLSIKNNQNYFSFSEYLNDSIDRPLLSFHKSHGGFHLSLWPLWIHEHSWLHLQFPCFQNKKYFNSHLSVSVLHFTVSIYIYLQNLLDD